MTVHIERDKEQRDKGNRQDKRSQKRHCVFGGVEKVGISFRWLRELEERQLWHPQSLQFQSWNVPNCLWFHTLASPPVSDPYHHKINQPSSISETTRWYIKRREKHIHTSKTWWPVGPRCFRSHQKMVRCKESWESPQTLSFFLCLHQSTTHKDMRIILLLS